MDLASKHPLGGPIVPRGTTPSDVLTDTSPAFRMVGVRANVDRCGDVLPRRLIRRRSIKGYRFITLALPVPKTVYEL